MGTVHAKDQMKTPQDPIDRSFGSGYHPCEQNLPESRTLLLDGIVARVDKVNIEGVVRTNDDLLKLSVRDLFTAGSFDEVVKKAQSVRGKLHKLGCFQSISIHIDTSNGPGASPNGYEVTYQVQELKRVNGGVSSSVSDNECVLVVTAALPNVWGKGEHLRGDYTFGYNRTRTINLTYMKPYLTENNLVGQYSLYQNDFEWPMSGYKVLSRGLLFDFAFDSLIKNQVWNQRLQWEGDWRELGVGNRYASFEVRENAGHTLKSAVKHIISRDLRDSNVFPSCGSLVKVVTELAGAGGNVAFLKNELKLQSNWALNDGLVTVQLSFNAGVMKSLDDNKPPMVCDNFFLGGPLTLRGFDMRGVGPNSDGSFTGGESYWSSGFHIYTPLPFIPVSGGFGELFRTHFFVNCGNVGNFSLSDLPATWEEQKNTLRLVSGLGLAMRIGQVARIELNYCVPLKSESSDATVEGFQFGVGVDFL